MTPFILTLVQTLFVLVAAPLVVGFIRWVKARLQGRHGASPWLMYYSYLTLLKKEHVLSPSRSWVFRLVPMVVCGLTLLFAIVLPLVFVEHRLVSIDFVVFAGLVTLSAVFLVFGGLESASAFGGMGSSREMTLAALVEPAVIVSFAGLSVVAGSANMDVMFSQTSIFSSPGLLVTAFALFLILLAENARYPVDNPATHLELTMVHEAMVLEYSGPSLALLEYASAVKLTVFLLLISQLLLPVFDWPLVSLLAAAGSLVVGSCLIAVIESTMAKMRFYRMQEYMTFTFFLALGGLILTLIV